MTQSTHVCPLCGSGGAECLERLRSSDIVALYRETLGLDVAAEFDGEDEVAYLRCARCGLAHFSPPVTGSNAFYQALQQHDWYYASEKYEFQYCARFIAPGSRVLDIGCGDGAFGALLRDVDYVGLEPNCRERTPGEGGAGVCAMDLDRFLAGDPEGFDVVCAFQVAEHVADPGAFLGKAVSCLKPGGLLCVSVPSHDSFLRDVTNSPLALPPHHVTHWPDSALRYLVELGLRLETLHHEPLQDVHVPWFCSKLYQEEEKKAPSRAVPGRVGGYESGLS